MVVPVVSILLYGGGGYIIKFYPPKLKALKKKRKASTLKFLSKTLPILLGTLSFYSPWKERKRYGRKSFPSGLYATRAVMTKEFQKHLFEQYGLEEKNYHAAPTVCLQIMSPGKNSDLGGLPEYQFSLQYLKEDFNSNKKIPECTYEGYAVFHCASSFDKYIKKYLAQEEATAG